MSDYWEIEVVQSEADDIKSIGFSYHCTYHDSNKKSQNYGKRIDIYRKKKEFDPEAGISSYMREP